MSLTDTYRPETISPDRRSQASAAGGSPSDVAGGPDTPPSARPPLIDAIGGKRGILDGALPPLIFVVVHAVAGANTTRTAALGAAIGAAGATGLAIVALRLLRKEPLRQALSGLAGLSIAVVFAATSGQARGFFLPGIYVDAAYAVVFAGSALIGRPLVGTIYGLLYRRREWRDDPRMHRLFIFATFGWSVVFAIRAGVQAFLYREDLPGLLAAGKLLLGWPLTILTVTLTLAAIRRRSTSPRRSAARRESAHQTLQRGTL
jgi:hypothetical protein